MKLAKRVITLLILPAFMLASNKGNRSVQGMTRTLEKVNEAINGSTEFDQAETEKTFDEARNKSSQIIDDLYVFDHINIARPYVNYFNDGQEELEKRENFFITSMEKFNQAHNEIIEVIEQYSAIDDNLKNLSKLYESGFTLDSSNTVYNEDFICDRGRIDFLSQLNGTYQYDFDLGFPSNVLNPDYADVYSVYDSVTEKQEDEGEDTDNSIRRTSEKAPSYFTMSRATVSTLTAALLNQGLSYAAVETIKASFLSTMAAIKYWLPWIARVAIISAAIIALTVVFVSYWSQIRQIVHAIVDRFVSVAEKCAGKIQELFSSIIKTANKSESELAYEIQGKRFYFRALTSAVAKSRTSYGDRIYHRAIRSSRPDFLNEGFTEEYVYVCLESLTKKEAVQILRSNPKDSEFSNTYTATSGHAKSVRKQAYPVEKIRKDHNKRGHGYFLYHYHAGKASPHSFYGLPYYLNN